MASNVSCSDSFVLFVSFVVRKSTATPGPIVGMQNDRGEQSGEREPPITRGLKSSCFGGGPVTAAVLSLFGQFQMKTAFRLLVLLSSSLLPNSFAPAEKCPLTLDELQRQADAIVVAQIEKIRIESGRSDIERGFGNLDWEIYLTLVLENVEKGDPSRERLEARCFRIKSRKSVRELLTPSGHHPIPGTGTRVRAHLRGHDGSWSVLLPNGLTSVEDIRGRPGAKLADAPEVYQLNSRPFTYLLPLELWIVVGVAVLIGTRRWRQRSRKNDATEQSVQPEPRAARFLKSKLVGRGPVNRLVLPQTQLDM